ncbi:hypothetical protein [Anaerococcus sp. AGMB09787]|uniref:hypothetical protein n=1 Tax=Anaerococcus sp. AGMB09787 TaxID=2922869 RepID=UPI001FAEEEF8|nr:hypothetical protein [Anaerococcus sp. AGMB09787]
MNWIILLGLVVIYFSLNEKFEKLNKLVKKQTRQNQEERGMSKVIQGLVNKKCLINTDEALTLVGKAEIEGLILETDEEWIKLEYLDKNREKKISVFRIDSVDYISVIE